MSASSDSAKPAQSNTTKPAATQPADNRATANGLPYLSNFASDVANNSWLLPDGVVDVLFEDAHKQEVLRHQLIQQLISHGYQLVNPPMIEFTESLLSEASEDLKRQTFKIIDQLTGRLMGVRADITPQILRIDAHHGGNGIARYCYAVDGAPARMIAHSNGTSGFMAYIGEVPSAMRRRQSPALAVTKDRG